MRAKHEKARKIGRILLSFDATYPVVATIPCMVTNQVRESCSCSQHTQRANHLGFQVSHALRKQTPSTEQRH